MRRLALWVSNFLEKYKLICLLAVLERLILMNRVGGGRFVFDYRETVGSVDVTDHPLEALSASNVYIARKKNIA